MIKQESGIIHVIYDEITTIIDCRSGIKVMCSTGINFIVPLNSLFTLHLDDKIVESSDCIIKDINISKDDTEELLTIFCHHVESDIAIKICILQHQDNSMSIILQMSDRVGVCLDRIYLCSPFLAGIAEMNSRLYFPSCPSITDNHHEIFQQCEQTLPLVVTDMDDLCGLSFAFPAISDLEQAVQNRNIELCKIKNKNELRHHRLNIRLSSVWSDQFEIVIRPLQNGWSQAFDIYRNIWLSNLSLSEYERPDLQWINEVFLHHFAFIFSKECYDYERGCIDLERIISQGNEFGGYGTILLWHQYPRLGIDERTQWDFYNDFPGGLNGLCAIVKQAHNNGIRVLLPYKPWDVAADQVGCNTFTHIIDIVNITQIDGFFLDTMDSPPQGLRQASDTAKAGVVLFSEIHPSLNTALEIVTASWDQYWHHDAMPEIDLLRFLLPSHHAPMVARWRNGIGKDMQIKRAMFNGTGMVIWQDIFGSWLPYSKDQKSLIRKYKDVWTNNLHIFNGKHPIPLYQTFTKDLFCNMFIDSEQHEIIYSFYNVSCKNITTDKIRLKVDTSSVSVLIGNGSSNIIANHLLISISAFDVLIVKAISI